MLKALRVRKAHRQFLEACRNLTQERDYWASQSGFSRWLLQAVCPFPLVGLMDSGYLLSTALKWLERNCQTTRLSVDVICEYHRMAMGEIPGAGVYRKVDMEVIGSPIKPAQPAKVPALMQRLQMQLSTIQVQWDVQRPTETVIFNFSADIYQRLGYIHPFEDGNGRISRLAVNHLMRRYGLGYVIFPSIAEFPELMEALQEGHKGRIDPLVRIAKERHTKI